ncbi:MULTISPECIES: hypothetical protein [unclassified Rathayibacter]|uniref:hypothetical protein n=1 Tax=unclassified Rathayibacter TaxID=2609250 RepID=UPI00188D6A12|nr:MULTISPECIES: hypothetical protein [unclassified Rathayibacter]MBF4463256.1 hypothetical protein [Rathayibacter sp. VKM Ac-2879]MBF4504507.1 hypothetical protein [Rathayibacter sp. VKM Ac-2878]
MDSTPSRGGPSAPPAPLPPRARFEPAALLTAPLHARALPASVRSRVLQSAPERRRRLAELASISGGFAVLRTPEFDRALRRIAAPASVAAADAAAVLAVGSEGLELMAERADALLVTEWRRLAAVGVGTTASGARRVRAVVLTVLAPRGAPPHARRGGLVSAVARASAEALAARRSPRTVLVPLVVASPGPLGWGVADDRTFRLALERLARAHREHTR